MFCKIDKAYDADVHGVAAPIFGRTGWGIGAVAVASSCHRMTPQLRDLIICDVRKVAVELTLQHGNRPPDATFPAWKDVIGALPSSASRR